MNNNMLEQMQIIRNYFDVIDGSPEAAEYFKEAFEKLFHKDVVFQYPEGELNYDGTVAAFQAASNKGGYADLVDLNDNGDGTATLTLTIYTPGIDNITSHQIAHFRDGKVVRVRAIDSDANDFGKMLQQCISLSNKEVAKKYAKMIACFDGSPDAYSKAKPLIDDIFDRDLVIDHGVEQKVCKDLDGFKEWAAAFSAKQNVAILEEGMEVTSVFLRVAIQNIVDGVDQGAVSQIGIIKDGKIVYWSADSSTSDEMGFDHLISSVAAQGEVMSVNSSKKSQSMSEQLQMVRDYFDVINGSPEAAECFSEAFSKVHHKDLTVEFPGGELNYDDSLAAFQTICNNGGYADLVDIHWNSDGTAAMTLKVHMFGNLSSDTDKLSHRVIHFRDGKVVRVHTIDSSVEPFGLMKQQCIPIPKQKTANKYANTMA